MNEHYNAFVPRNDRIGVLRAADFPADDPETYVAPLYHFEQPDEAPSGLVLISVIMWFPVINDQPSGSFYDLVIELNSGPLYIARANDGTVMTTTKSSKGQTPMLVNGASLTTTLFTTSCEGKLTMATIDTLYAWQASGEYTVAPADSDSSSMVLIVPTRFTTSKAAAKRQSEFTEGEQPRCPKIPSGLIAYAKDPNRPPNSNGCGSTNTDWLVPDFSFGPACNNHDNCYGMIHTFLKIMSVIAY